MLANYVVGMLVYVLLGQQSSRCINTHFGALPRSTACSQVTVLGIAPIVQDVLVVATSLSINISATTKGWGFYDDVVAFTSTNQDCIRQVASIGAITAPHDRGITPAHLHSYPCQGHRLFAKAKVGKAQQDSFAFIASDQGRVWVILQML